MKKIYIAFIALFAATALNAETSWLRVTREGKAQEFSVSRTVSEANGQRTIEEVSERGHNLFVLRSDGQAIRYEVSFKEGSCTMIRENDAIHVSGTVKGKNVDAVVKLGKAAWFGTIEQGLRHMRENGETDLVAMLMNPVDPSKAIEMRYLMVADEQIGGIAGHKVKISLTGLLANFWGATYWIDDNGNTLRYEGDNGPGTPKMTVEFVRAE